jgi:hypothetical protein
MNLEPLPVTPGAVIPTSYRDDVGGFQGPDTDSPDSRFCIRRGRLL